MNPAKKIAVPIRSLARPSAIALLCALGAFSANAVENPPASTWPTQGWDTAPPADVGMKSFLLKQARDYALTGGGAGVITRSGKLVYSWGNKTERFDLKSTTKSIGVTVLGLALQDGLVGLTDTAQLHLADIGVPPESNAGTGWLGDITVLHLATHRAGFDKHGGFTELLFKPGTAWSYSDGGANWLADILTVSYGMDLKDLMFARVFGPLGIKANDLTWRNNAYRPDTLNGVTRREFGSGIDADVDAMARIGYLYLRQGAWEGQRIVPASFVAQASRPEPGLRGLPVRDPQENADVVNRYGLLWWNNGDGRLTDVPADSYWSWGLFDSLIIVVPSLDIVVARAGRGWQPGWETDYSVIEPFIQPIARSVTGVSISQTPIVSIDAPAEGAPREAATPITFRASATDAEDGNLTNGLLWTSDRDGMIGTGASFSTLALSAGAHVITASVTDSGGLAGAANVIVIIDGNIGASTLTLLDTGDTFSNKGLPAANFGSKRFMRVHGPNEKKIGFVQFDMADLSGTVIAAVLKLYVRDVPDAGVVEVRAVQAAWNERDLTHKNKPDYGAALASMALSPADEGTVISLDVTSLVQQWAASPAPAYGLALTSPNLHALFDTREAAYAPVIEVDLQ